MKRTFAAALLGCAVSGVSACVPSTPHLSWTCDFDASESRPLSDIDATPDETGALPAAECQATCGPPATSCTYTMLEAGPGAVCPVCTF